METPKIGNDVYIRSEAVLYGDIAIAEGCYIGANAVVNTSYDESYSIIEGIPAKLICKVKKQPHSGSIIEFNAIKHVFIILKELQ